MKKVLLFIIAWVVLKGQDSAVLKARRALERGSQHRPCSFDVALEKKGAGVVVELLLGRDGHHVLCGGALTSNLLEREVCFL